MTQPNKTQTQTQTQGWINLLLAAPFIASLLALWSHPSEWRELIIYGIFYALAVLPMSVTGARLLLPKLQLGTIESAALGYPISIVLMSTGFAIFKSLGAPEFSLILPATFLAAFVWKTTKREKRKNTQKARLTSSQIKSTFIILLIYTVSSILLFSSFTLTTSEPTAAFGSNVYEDTLWTIGNTWSALYGGIPLQDFRFSGINLGYHVAQNLYYASSSWITGITPDTLHLRIVPFYDNFFLVLCICIGGKIFWSLDSVQASLLPIPVLFSSVQITALKVGADPGLSDILGNPISMVFGLSSFILILQALSAKQENHKASIAYLGILYTLATGTKAILGVLIPGGYILFILLKWLTQQLRPKKRELLTLAVMGIIFFLLIVTIFSGSTGHTVFPKIEISPVALRLGRMVGLESSVEKLYVIIGPASRFTRFIFHTLVWNWLVLPIILLSVFDLSGRTRRTLRENQNFLLLLLGFTITSGLFYSLNIFKNYWSNLYFYRYSIACSSLLLGIVFSSKLKITRPRHLKLFSTRVATFCTSLVVLTIPIFKFFDEQFRFIGSEAWKEERVQAKTSRPLAFLSQDEYTALKWIRYNTPRNSIIASDRKEKEGWSGNYVANVWFAYSAYSGRQFYNEGDDYNLYAVERVSAERWNQIQLLLQSQDADNALKNWKEIKADFLIITKRINKISPQLRSSADIVFENKGMLVLKNPTTSMKQSSDYPHTSFID